MIIVFYFAGGNIMACFLAPAAEAVVTTVVQKKIEKNEKGGNAEASATSIPWSRKLRWLNTMLWGGVALLFIEHVWHGEITATFPFFTAVANGETLAMLKEIALYGGIMCIVITAIWFGMIKIADRVAAKSADEVK